jgi:hypothetical protein
MITQWKKKLTKVRFGKIWWYNFQYDLSIHNLPRELQQQFLKAIEQQLAASNNEAPPLEILIEVLESPSQVFSLKGRPVGDVKQLSCVVNSHAFAHFLVDRYALGLPADEVLERKVWQWFEQGEINPELYYKGEIKSRRNFFWATLTNSLNEALSASGTNLKGDDAEELGEKVGRLATDVRNLLGLSYMPAGVGLYRIDLPDNLPSGVAICVPTTLDSSPSCVFLPTDSHSNLGQTFHLSKLDTGVEEVVISPLEFTKDCKVTQIGFVSTPLPDDDSVWLALEERVVHRHSRKLSGVKRKQKKAEVLMEQRRHA